MFIIQPNCLLLWLLFLLYFFFFFADGLFVDSDDGLPEPPAFLRDIVYPPDGRDPRYDSDGRDPRYDSDGRDPRYDSDGPAPYHPPPSPGRQRQVGSQDAVIPQFFGHRNNNEILS